MGHAKTSLSDQVRTDFIDRYGEEPAHIVRAPGRVNLIGGHTDYNEGFVLPMAVEHSIWIALRRRDDRRVILHSLDMEETAECSLDALEKSEPLWFEYVKGTAWALAKNGRILEGWEGVMRGDIPIGAGLSSSAALEIASARAFFSIADLAYDAVEFARAGQRAENDWLGLNTGIMDQMISAAGEVGKALLIDCRSLDAERVPLPAGSAVVVLDTATRRGLVESAYNERRSQCEEAAKYLAVPALRDVSVERFEKEGTGLDPVVRRRAKHIVHENARVLATVQALKDGDAEEAGRLMSECHTSLRDDYEVSGPALDAIVESAQSHEACYGARMTGAGFAGCAVALIRVDKADEFVRHVISNYENRTGKTPKLYLYEASA